jgi:hypothetical protein
MVSYCKGVCSNAEHSKRLRYGTTNEHGQPAKFCSRCGFFKFIDEIRCHCCGNLFRTSPQNYAGRRYNKKDEVIKRID